MPPRCSLPPLARTRHASWNRPRRVKSSQIGISLASNIASKSFAWSAAIRRTIAVVSVVLAAATLAFRGMRRRCERDYLSPNQSPVKRAYQAPHGSILMRQACRSDRMVDIGFPELLTLVQTVAIIVAIVIAVYFSRRQIQALATDTEARVMNDLDEKLHRMGAIFMENPEFVRILNDVPAASGGGAEVAFAFYVMFFCSHCYHMRQRGILSDNDWRAGCNGRRTPSGPGGLGSTGRKLRCKRGSTRPSGSSSTGKSWETPSTSRAESVRPHAYRLRELLFRQGATWFSLNLACGASTAQRASGTAEERPLAGPVVGSPLHVQRLLPSPADLRLPGGPHTRNLRLCDKSSSRGTA